MAAAAVAVRFLDPYTSVVQTDDARVAAEWTQSGNYWPMPAGLADPLEKPSEESWAARLARRAMRKPWVAPRMTPRIVHTLFRVHGETPGDYDPESPSPLFKVNQVGYLPWAPKYAYMGAWLGPSLGAWKPHAEPGGWQLVDAATGEVAKDSSEPPRVRVSDAATKEGTPFTGEETYEMDFSDVRREGEYYVRVPGVGRSRTFRIGSGAAEEAFRVHMGGLFQKRCGCAKGEPWTHWTAGACHAEAVRGTFPPEEGTLQPKTRWFDIVRFNTDWKHGEKLRLAGGWHDAADYDRRPQHLQIVSDLCAVWTMRPGNFGDGQLAIPESANGVPDILDEAEWGLRHLLAGQQRDGGVGTWVESTGHPEPGNVAERDEMPYALSAATRRSSLMYAACAAQLARCGEGFRKKYLASAERAWDFALRTKPRTAMYVRRIKEWKVLSRDEAVYWDEDRELPAQWLVKAAVNLHALTGDGRYLEPLADAMQRLLSAADKEAWAWPPLLFSGERTAETPAALEAFFARWERRVRHEADEALRQVETAYAYRVPWWAPGSGKEHTMAWGSCHPLRRAQWLVAAHGLTGDAKYLEAASLANDFHNGCNPQGTTLTSGLGDVYPVAFLDLPSYVDGIAEYVPGITPYRWTYGMPAKAVEMAFRGDKARATKWPIWRRWGNFENQTVAASEYTVWETIAPAASVTGYLLEPSGQPPPPQREPATSLRELEGYWVLP